MITLAPSDVLEQRFVERQGPWDIIAAFVRPSLSKPCLMAGVFVAWLAADRAAAQIDFGRLLNPGPLAAPHAALEGVTNCVKCHATAKGVPDEKCLDCHTEIAERLRRRRGYHARLSEHCVACHSDHKGRAYDLTGLTRLAFDHQETGWPLTGAHTSVPCQDCHTQKRVNVMTGSPTNRTTYLGAQSACVFCHEDPHKAREVEQLECDRCHTTEAWNVLRARPDFNHDRDSRYPLTGKHASVRCYDCHKSSQWAPLPFDRCTRCHADPHKGKLGPRCERCHTTKDWDTPAATQAKEFDHDKTAFPLTGEHKDVTCLRCHGPVIGKMKGFEQCDGCHNNPHGRQFETLWDRMKRCTDCHVTDGWTILNFRHDADSRFRLDGRHGRVPCLQCHTDRKYRWLTAAPDCDVCHIDVHSRQFENKTCAGCHTPEGFDRLLFDHNRNSRFPLVGKHASVPCQSCHVGGRYKPLETLCGSCHNDPHEGTLGNACTQCHAPTDFRDIDFDHNRQARFRLDGEHLKTACNQCHVGFRYKLGFTGCADCHIDVHKGEFGSACERCHTSTSFTAKAGFHDFGEFSLGGAHDRLECLTCHDPKAVVRTGTSQCTSCHRDPHMNAFNDRCWECHTQVSWLPSTFRHNQTGFELSGAHRFLSCDACHFNRVFGGLPSDCAYCHLRDFRRTVRGHETASFNCESCHFTFGWRPARGGP